MSQLGYKLSQYWNNIQGTLFSWLEEQLDPLTEKQQQLVTILELVRIEQFLPYYFKCEGRPLKTRSAIARSFVAKTIYNMETNTHLIERLKTDKNLRRICGWESRAQLPHESTFSRAFAEFAKTSLAQRTHEALINKFLKDEVVLHIRRDSTAVKAREQPVKQVKKNKSKQLAKSTQRGRPKKCEQQMPQKQEVRRIEKQKNMTLSEMLEDLPKLCDKGVKKDSKGNLMHWNGYKLHLDTIDGDIPVSAIVTSASVHDSQVAIALATLTAKCITNCYDVMDAGYDDVCIFEHSKSLGHVPLIKKNPRSSKQAQKELKEENLARKTLNWMPAEEVHFNTRSGSERANSRIKDEFGASHIRVRGHGKVTCHLMFGVLVLAADQLIKLAM